MVSGWGSRAKLTVVIASSRSAVRYCEMSEGLIMPSSLTNEKRTVVRGLGEIAFRVSNLDATQKFYEEVLGLPLMTRVPNCAFFKIADGYGGHTQVLALFDR